MKKAFIPVLAVLALLSGGCNIKWTVVQDPYPNFHLIERRCQLEDQQIGTAVQNGQLPPPIAQALTDNVSLIRQMAWQDQNPDGAQTMDLTAPQTRYLGVLLNDNQMAINDALTRPDQWANAFQGGWNYNFSYRQDRLLFIANLHHQLVAQEAMVEDGAGNGSLSSTQVADLRSRIQVIREAEWDDFNQNGSFDLNRDQMEELSEMVEDNFRYIRFRSRYSGRSWSGDRFESWGQYKKDFAVNSSTLPKNPTSGNRYWDGRTRTQNSVQAVPTATPVPYVAPARPTPTKIRPLAPTATPVPYNPPPAPTATPVPPTPVPTVPSNQGLDNGNQKDQGKHEGFDKKDLGDGQGLDQGNHKDQGKHEGSEKKDQGDQGVKADKAPEDKAANPSDSKDGTKTDKAPADKTTNPSDSKDGVKTDQAPVLVKPDALNDRYDQLMDRMRSSRLHGRNRADFNDSRNDFRQTLMQTLKDNQQKGLTQAQFDRLNKMLDDMEALLPSDNQ